MAWARRGGVNVCKTPIRTKPEDEPHITADVETVPEQGFNSTVRW
jgi:hypothetical protein